MKRLKANTLQFYTPLFVSSQTTCRVLREMPGLECPTNILLQSVETQTAGIKYSDGFQTHRYEKSRLIF